MVFRPLQEDKRLLEGGQLSECSCQAVQLRACEKRILQYASQYGQQAKWLIESRQLSKEGEEKRENSSAESKEGQNGHSAGEAVALERQQDSVAGPEEELGRQNGASSEDSGQGQSGASLGDSGEGEGPEDEGEGPEEKPVLTGQEQ